MTARRGEIWYADLDPTQGSEQSGRRPILVIQEDAVNRHSTTVIAIPFTTNLRRAALPTCVRVDAGVGGLAAESVLLCHQIRALDGNRLRDRLGSVDEETMADIERCLLFTLGIRLES